MFVTNMTKYAWLNTVMFNLFKNFRGNSVKSVKSFCQPNLLLGVGLPGSTTISRSGLHTKMHMVNYPNCLVCGVREDNVHIFAECLMVREAWGWVRMRLLDLLSRDSARC